MDIYFDGGCSPNPGQRTAGVVLCTTPKTCLSVNYGYGTNNEAEWLGLLTALVEAKELGYFNIQLIGDSNMVIQQASGKWKVNALNLLPYYNTFLKVKTDFEYISFKWVRRDLNLAGIYLEKGYI
jgi:ribonuclease HI